MIPGVAGISLGHLCVGSVKGTGSAAISQWEAAAKQDIINNF
jgi:hypothetical protein